MALRHEDLAQAYLAVARANHYMVGIVGDISQEDRERAKALLIGIENSLEGITIHVPGQPAAILVKCKKQVKLALDLLEQDERNATLRASRGE